MNDLGEKVGLIWKEVDWELCLFWMDQMKNKTPDEPGITPYLSHLRRRLRDIFDLAQEPGLAATLP